jgi:hypothetical protein
MHQDPQMGAPELPQQERSRSWVPWMAAAAAVIALVIYVWPGVEKRPGPRGREIHLPFGEAEQAYAPKLQIENLELTRAENFLHQEVYTLSGELVNTGDRPVRNVELTVEFSDELPQVVLRESRVVFSSVGPPLAPAERREFEISFEHIPTSWNRQQPAIRATGILFAVTNK